MAYWTLFWWLHPAIWRRRFVFCFRSSWLLI